MKTFFKKLLVTVSLVQMNIASSAFAKEERVEQPIAESLAIATANTVNRLGTVEKYLEWLKHRSEPTEVARLEKYLLSVGVKKSQKFPRLKAFGSKVYFNSREYMTYSAREIVIEGRKFSQQQESIDVVVKNIVEKLQKPRTAWYSMILPEAHASSALSSALIGLVAGGALGYFAGPSFGTTNTDGALAGALLGSVAGLGVNYLGSETNYYMGPRGRIVCNGSNYNIVNGTGTYLGNQQTYQQQVPPGVVLQMYNGQRPCTSTNAQYFQTNVRNWNQPQYMANVNPQQHPGTILGVAQ